MGPVSRRRDRRPLLERQDAGADQVGQALALVLVEQRVQPPERARHRVAQPLGGRDPRPAASLARASSNVSPATASANADSDRRRSTSAWARSVFSSSRMRASSAHLLLVELQLVGQEAQRPPDAERRRRRTPPPRRRPPPPPWPGRRGRSRPPTAARRRSSAARSPAVPATRRGAHATMTPLLDACSFPFLSPRPSAPGGFSRGRYASRVVLRIQV